MCDLKEWSTQKTHWDHTVTVFTRWPFHIVTTPGLWKLCKWCVIWFELILPENTLRSSHTVTLSNCDHCQTMKTVWMMCDLKEVLTDNTLKSHCVHTVTLSNCDHSQTMKTVCMMCDLKEVLTDNTLRSHCVHTVTISHSDHSQTLETVWMMCDLNVVGPHRKHTEITLYSHGDHFT